jgi:hypothetical protein
MQKFSLWVRENPLKQGAPLHAPTVWLRLLVVQNRAMVVCLLIDGIGISNSSVSPSPAEL